MALFGIIRGRQQRRGSLTLTPASFDKLTTLSRFDKLTTLSRSKGLAKGSPLKGEGDHGKGHYREEI
jgi:hypothetical protein